MEPKKFRMSGMAGMWRKCRQLFKGFCERIDGGVE